MGSGAAERGCEGSRSLAEVFAGKITGVLRGSHEVLLMAIKVQPRTETLEIYSNFNWPDDIPRKPFNELTAEQQQRIRTFYRFAGFRPGTYQGITGKGIQSLG